MLALTPLLILPGLLFYFDMTPKVAVVLLGTAAALPWAAAWLRTSRGTVRWFAVLLGAQAFSLLLSTALSASPALSLSGTNWRRFGLVTQLAILAFAMILSAWLAARPGRLPFVLRVMALTGIPVALYGILQYFGWDPWIPTSAYRVGEGVFQIVRPPSTLGHASYFATYLLYPVFAGVALAITEPGRGWRAAGAVAAGLASLAILLSGTRAALLALAAGGLFLALWIRPRVSLRTAAATVALAAALGAFYLGPAGARLRGRVHWTLTEQPLGGARRLLWRDSCVMAAHHWFAGYGPETFSAEFPRFQSVALAQEFPDFYHESPHNIFLDALTAQGLPGLSILLLLSGLGFVAARRVKPSQTRLAGALAAGLTAGLLSQQFVVFTVPTALYFYATAAILAALASEPFAGAPPRRVLAGFAALPLAVLMVVFAVRLLVADRMLELVKRDLESGNLRSAVAAYEEARQWQLPGTGADLWYSRRLALFARDTADPVARLQALPHAVAAATRATSVAEDRHNAFYNLATLNAAQNDLAGTERSLRSAIFCSPNWFKPHWMLARVLQISGRSQEALREASLAVKLDAGKDFEVSRTLAEMRGGQGRR